MTKILNLDELETPSDKVLKFKGKDHKFHPLTVDEFIDQMKKAEARDAEGEVPVSEFVNEMVAMIMRAFPTVEEADIRDLEIAKLKAISDFVNDVNKEEAEKADAAAKG